MDAPATVPYFPGGGRFYGGHFDFDLCGRCFDLDTSAVGRIDP